MGETPLRCMPVLIECAILGSPHQLLTVAELRVAIKKRFSFYEKEDEKGSKTWWVSSMPSSPACSFPIPLHLFLGGSFVLFFFCSSVVVLFCQQNKPGALCSPPFATCHTPIMTQTLVLPLCRLMLTFHSKFQKTLRENLTKVPRFVLLARPAGECGKGGYWTINHDAPPANRIRQRPIKRLQSVGKRGKKYRLGGPSHPTAASPTTGSMAGHEVTLPSFAELEASLDDPHTWASSPQLLNQSEVAGVGPPDPHRRGGSVSRKSQTKNPFPAPPSRVERKAWQGGGSVQIW